MVDAVETVLLDEQARLLMPILVWPDSLALRLRSKEVTEFDDFATPEPERELRRLVATLGTTMFANNGVGLSAIQVGILRRVVVLRDEEGGSLQPGVAGDKPVQRYGVFAFFNPRIVERSDETEADDEGCLSLPGFRVRVERAVQIKVEHETAYGETIQMEATGREARVLQHEIDHLDGVLIFDHLEERDRRAALSLYRRARAGQ